MERVKLRHGRVTAGALTVLADFDETDSLVSVKLPRRVPANLTIDDLTSVVTELARHPIALDAAPPFHRSVWEKLRAIPPGQTLTYGAIATALGNPRASRAVGQACAANRLALVIPCHRVLGVAGLGGFAWGLAWKKKLLELEAPIPRKPPLHR